MIFLIKTVIFFFCIFESFITLAQSSKSAHSTHQQKINFNLDVASFRYDQNDVYLEIYFSFLKNQFQIVRQDSQDVVLFGIDTKIYQNDSLKFSRYWKGKHLITDKNEQNKELLTIKKFILPSGDYRLVTQLTDLLSGLKGTKEINLNLSFFPEIQLAISDIELAISIVRDSTRNIYTKNQYKVIPNPGAFYDINRPILYFYTEIYNLSANLDSTYSVEYNIIDSQERIIKTFPEKTRIMQSSSLVEVGGLNIITLPAGSYILELRVTDNGNFNQISKRKKFYFHKGKIAPAIVAELHSNPLLEYYKRISEKALNQEFENSKYIATKKEKNLFKSLDLAGKQSYLVQFWSKRDRIHETIRNERREVYLNRVKLANDQFSGLTKGWKTDRGRVLIMYGKPEEVERNPSIGEMRGYEIWQYFNTSQSHIIFVFVDKLALQDFELVHSTARGETYDPDWQRWIYMW